MKNAASLELILRFDKAVAAPFFVLGKSSVADWKLIRNAPAPSAELAGRNLIFHLPAAEVRQLDNPGPLLERWDPVVAAPDRLVWQAGATPHTILSCRVARWRRVAGK